MPESVIFSTRLDCVYVVSKGIVTLDEVNHSIKKVNSLLKKYNTKKLIVDVRRQEKPPELIEIYDICKFLLPKLPENLKLAYLVSKKPRESHLFFTERSLSLGYKMDLFCSLELALKWINGQLSPYVNPCNGKIPFPSLSDTKQLQNFG